MFNRLFWRDPNRQIARRIYDGLVQTSRQPAFYEPGGAPDTVDGRFDMIVLHAILVMRRLRDGNAAARDLSQSVFDVMFDDMDAALREMGAGDLGVGRKIREMGEAFYGRARAYETGLSESDEEGLAKAISRNMFGESRPDSVFSGKLAVYAINSTDILNAQSIEAFLRGEAAQFADYI